MISLWCHIYGGQRGVLALFSGLRSEPDSKKLDNPRTTYFAWPDERERARAWVEREALEEGRETYHCAHLLIARRRVKDNAAPLLSLYVDGDAGDGLEMCEHYHYLHEAWQRSEAVKAHLTKEEQDLVYQAERLETAIPIELRMPELYDRPTWHDIPEGYYAVPDPRDDVEEMTYWRRKDKGKNKRPTFESWPSKARYAPVLYRKDVPNDLGDLPEKEYVTAWYKTLSRSYRDAIVEAITEDPVAAGQRFADWAIRCCCCGKALTNDLSKVYGIGPECRKGMPAEVLAKYYRPEVGRVHAASL